MIMEQNIEKNRIVSRKGDGDMKEKETGLVYF